jgi:transposase
VAIPPGHILEARALLETCNDLRREHTAWVQRIHAVLFHQGAPALGEGTLRTGQGVAALRAAAAEHLSPAGQLQMATALEVTEALEARLHAVRHQLLAAARHLTGAKVLAARLYGVGPVTALAITCWLAGEGRFSSSRQAVRFAGLDIIVHSSDRKARPGSCPGRDRRCCAGRSIPETPCPRRLLAEPGRYRGTGAYSAIPDSAAPDHRSCELAGPASS